MNFFQFTTVGRDLLLNVAYRGTTPITAWYASLIEETTFSAVDDADTMSSHAGWVENQNYNEATRVQWSPTLIENTKLSSSTPLTFTASSTTGPIRVSGYFVTSVNTKGGTTGTLMGMKIWDTPIIMPHGEALYLPITHDIYMATLYASGEDDAGTGEGDVTHDSGGGIGL